jgi:threonine aldolase
MDDECGAPEFFAGGAKLVGVEGRHGKITPDTLSQAIAAMPAGARHCPPKALTLSQTTEIGTIYSPDELRALCAVAHDAGMLVHMDGARFANALVATGCAAADMTWRAGIDVLSLGATKNGALACEAVIFFDPARAKDFIVQRKRGGHTWSKGRFLGAQMCAWLADGHWRLLAAHANAQAQRLADGLLSMPHVRLPVPRGANEVFAIIPRERHAAVLRAGGSLYEWNDRTIDAAEGPHPHEVFVRLVTSFATTPAEVEQFLVIVGDLRDDAAIG